MSYLHNAYGMGRGVHLVKMDCLRHAVVHYAGQVSETAQLSNGTVHTSLQQNRIIYEKILPAYAHCVTFDGSIRGALDAFSRAPSYLHTLKN